MHKEWGNLGPTKTPVNNCHEIIMDSQGRLIMVGDNAHNNVLIYGKSGKLLDSWGIRYKGGHRLTFMERWGRGFTFHLRYRRNHDQIDIRW